MKKKSKAFALLAAAAVAVSSFAGAVNVSAYSLDSAVQGGTSQVLGATGMYTISPNETIVYSQLPAEDKMIGWAWSEFGIGAGETIEKVEIEISTNSSTIGIWEGAFGSSTTESPDYWTQTEDMKTTIDGNSGTITWEVDPSISEIIQTEYDGELKWGVWWIDCTTFTVDNINVYTDAYTGGGNTGGNTGGSTTGGGYTINPNETIVYSQLPAEDKMIGWAWSEFGIGAGETIEKVEIDISTSSSTIGIWEGAFGSSTTESPDYWIQTEDMLTTIDGNSGTITWEVDPSISAIIQTEYDGELKWGVWWIDCTTFTVDSITVYTDKSGGSSTTTTTTTTTRTTTTTTKTTTTTTRTTTTTGNITTSTDDVKPSGLYVQMGGRAADGESEIIPAGASGLDAAYIGLEAYNASELLLTMRGQFKLGDALAEIATPYLIGEWLETYDFGFGSEVWMVNPENLVFAANATFESQNVFEDGELIFGCVYEIADAATVKATAEKYGIDSQQADDGTWYYAFPIHLVTDFPYWEWVGTDEENIYPDGLSLVETSYVYIEAEGSTSEGTTTTSNTTTTTSNTTTTTTSNTTTTTTTMGDDDYNDFNDLIGDVNLDGKIGIQDIIHLNKYNAGIVKLNEQALRNAECKTDGTIDANDLTALMQYLVNIISSLPA